MTSEDQTAREAEVAAIALKLLPVEWNDIWARLPIPAYEELKARIARAIIEHGDRRASEARVAAFKEAEQYHRAWRDGMTHDQFKLGTEFVLSGHKYRVTDVGSRTVVAIRLGPRAIMRSGMKVHISEAEAISEGWFNGPPYGVVEHVIDEDSFPICSPVEAAT